MKILVSGATGFIGRNLVKELIKRGNEVYCLVRRTSPRVNFLREIDTGDNEYKSPMLKLIYGDITDKESLAKIEGDFKVFFHCAGAVENRNWRRLYMVNVKGTENVCELALRLGVERLIYLSSVAVVSGNSEVPLYEDLPYKSTNLYGESKIEAEKRVLDARKKGLRVCILRPCMVYGREEPHLLNLLLFLLKYRLFPLLEEGKHLWHLLYIGNLINALILALNNDKLLEKVFFVADEDILTVKEVLFTLCEAIGAKPPFNLPNRFTPLVLSLPYFKKLKFFLKDRVYSIERIKSVGYRSLYRTKDALRKSVCIR